MKYDKKINISSVIDFISNCSVDTKVYVGCDSERMNVNGVWYADYITTVVIHVNGNNGCKIFGAVDREREWEQRSDKPKMRLMNEVYRVADLYLELCEHIDNDIEVHLDINPNEKYASSVIINEAIGYIKGVCNTTPMVKPYSFAASCAADRFKGIIVKN